MQSNKLWTKQFISVSLINFLLTLVFYLLMVTIATFAINLYQASMSQSRLVSGIFIIGGVIGRLFAGYFINKFGLKRLLLITIIICLAIIGIYFININVQFLILIRLLHGMALTIISSIATQIIPESRKSEGISYYSMSTTLATAFGPFLGILMIHYISFSILFSFCFAIMCIALIMSLFVKVPKVTEIKTASVNLEKGTSFLKNIIEPSVIPVGLIILLLSFAYSGVLTYLNLYTSQV
ncbi:MFS transporter [Staphylococcus nepalensis]|uniref:MFS transporter n=1 Tax=Staphylococcus nepalensis TaxID=214473 RepID=UPI001F602667|nr:MFS transporter [Staphylococcus nepalensis]